MVKNQDCTEFLKNCPDEHFDFIIADTPYFQIYGDFDFIWKDLNEYLFWSKTWITECKRVLKENGAFYLWGP